MNDIEQRLKELDNDKEFLSELEKAKTDDELIEVFQKNGIDLTKKDIEDFLKSAAKAEELSEEELNDVSGGKSEYYKFKLLWYVYKKLKFLNKWQFL